MTSADLNITWKEDADGPELTDVDYARYAAAGDAAVMTAIQQAPGLRTIAQSCEFVLDTDPEELSYAYCCPTVDGPAAIVLPTRTIDRFEALELAWTVAHEMTHLLLGHASRTDPHSHHADDVLRRMVSRATEPLVNDTVARLGFPAPRSLPVNSRRRGQQMLGFELTGLTRREVFDVLAARSSRDELHALAVQRQTAGRLITRDTNWSEDALRIDERVRVFWQDRRGPWQTDWDAALRPAAEPEAA